MEKVSLFRDFLCRENIDKQTLSGLCFSGIPDEFDIRPISWKLLLGYSPISSDGPNVVKKLRTRYESLVKDILQDNESFVESQCEDHPLNSHPNSYWSSYFKDNEVLLQINKDVRRLCPHMQFFQGLTQHPYTDILRNGKSLTLRVHRSLLMNESLTKQKSGIINLSSYRKQSVDIPPVAHEENLTEYHWEVCQRILFAYAKLNPGQSYIQGMNEILGPIYYVMANCSDENERKYAEHDSFYCFTNLMSEIRDNFIPTMDRDKNHGIGSLMRRLNEILKIYDVQLYEHFKSQDLQPQYFCYRWLMLLFSQEFCLPDVIRLWDSIFSTTDKGTFSIYLSISMLTLIRTRLLEGDFAHNLKLLQNYPNIDILKIISKSLEIEEEMTRANSGSGSYSHGAALNTS